MDLGALASSKAIALVEVKGFTEEISDERCRSRSADSRALSKRVLTPGLLRASSKRADIVLSAFQPDGRLAGTR